MNPSNDHPARPGRRRQAPTPDEAKILFVCSSGGHLAQLWQLRPWWRDKPRQWVTFDKPDARSLLRDEEVVWAHHPTTRNAMNALRNALLAWRLLRGPRPSMVVSNGAGVAFPFFVVARVLGVPTAYIEVCDRLDSASLTGRLCYRLSDLFCIQDETQRRFYRHAHLIGRVL